MLSANVRFSSRTFSFDNKLIEVNGFQFINSRCFFRDLLIFELLVLGCVATLAVPLLPAAALTRLLTDDSASSCS